MITVKVTGMKQLSDRVKRIEKAPKTVLKQLGENEVTAAKQRIQSSKIDPDGKAWKPWSFATMKERMRQGNAGNGLLYRTGALLNSITHRLQGLTLSIFSNRPYAGFLQFGTPKMPARAFIGWSKTSINTLRDLYQKETK